MYLRNRVIFNESYVDLIEHFYLYLRKNYTTVLL